jgi:hypothetical protein
MHVCDNQFGPIKTTFCITLKWLSLKRVACGTIKSASYTNSLALIIKKNWCGMGSAHTWWRDTGPKLIYNTQDVRNTNKSKRSCCLPSIHMQYGPKLLVLECLFPTGRKRKVSCAPPPPILASSEVEQSIALVRDGPWSSQK